MHLLSVTVAVIRVFASAPSRTSMVRLRVNPTPYQRLNLCARDLRISLFFYSFATHHTYMTRQPPLQSTV